MNGYKLYKDKIMKTSCPVIDIHASWLALNPIHGCPFSCKYCFLNGVNLTSKKPLELVSPKEAVKSLLNFKFYNKNFPLCLFTSTDIFGTPSNIEYAIKILEELYKNNVFNPIIFITKQYIPNYFLDIIDEYEKKSMKFVFMISYSGLNNNIEIGINKEKIKQNFINLKNRNKKIIHYWRPFLPENSTEEVLEDVYNFVKKYANCSISIGLKVQPSYIGNLNFWEKLFNEKEHAYSYESVWTKNAYRFIEKKKHEDYPIFNTTSCALSYALTQPDYNAFYRSKFCKSNNCPLFQKELCAKTKNCLNKKIIDDIISKFMKKTNYSFDYSIDLSNNKIIIEKDLKTAEIVYLKMLTNMIIVCNKSKNDYYWATTNIANEIMILEE